MPLSSEQVRHLPHAKEYIPGFWLSTADPVEAAKTKHIKENNQPIKGTGEYYRTHLKGWQKLKYMVRSFFSEPTNADHEKLDKLIDKK